MSKHKHDLFSQRQDAEDTEKETMDEAPEEGMENFETITSNLASRFEGAPRFMGAPQFIGARPFLRVLRNFRNYRKAFDQMKQLTPQPVVPLISTVRLQRMEAPAGVATERAGAGAGAEGGVGAAQTGSQTGAGAGSRWTQPGDCNVLNQETAPGAGADSASTALRWPCDLRRRGRRRGCCDGVAMAPVILGHSWASSCLTCIVMSLSAFTC